ncbi:MAG: response regulator [Verrucomicrobia bacterium]|nr:response regulator [Verrucomicrobiota bacterium]
MTIRHTRDGGMVVLLVEDDHAHAELIRYCFENQPLLVDLRHLEDGEQARKYLHREGTYSNEEESPVPHLVLLDLRLPKVDGLMVLELIKSKETWRQIPVVVLTTSQAESDIAKAYTHHANGYCVKPVHFPEFESLMKDLGMFWLTWSRNGSAPAAR